MTPEEIEEKKRSRNLDSEHNNHMQQDQQLKKLLLLGAGESGAHVTFAFFFCTLFMWIRVALVSSEHVSRSEYNALPSFSISVSSRHRLNSFCVLSVRFVSSFRALAHSGKSTLFKQAIALYGAKPTHAEMMQFVPIICNNIIQNIKTLIKYSEELRYAR
jgi:hypothetical protein